jgi:hypothetical protein
MPRPRSTLLTLGCLGLPLVGAGCPDHTCRDIQGEAAELRTAFSRCKAGDRCVVVDLSKLLTSRCLGDLQCSVGMPEIASQQDFARQAKAIDADYENCTECAQASCVAASALEAKCNEATGACELSPRP